MRSFKEQLEREAELMGRPVTYRNGWEYSFTGQDGRERLLRVIVFDVAPFEVVGVRIEESRFVAWDSVGDVSGGIIDGS